MSDFQKVLSLLLKGSRLKQPFLYDGSKVNFKDDLQERFSNYLKRINKMSVNEGPIESYLFSKKDELNELIQNLMYSLDDYLSGSAGKAYSRFELLMELPIVKDNISKIIYNLKDLLIDKLNIGKESLYRVRCSNFELKTRQEMFHIPFNLRHLVGTQRYSIAGLPCLYLGSSIYVCWQEMGKPELDKMYISKYEYKGIENKKIINFAYSLETLKYPEESLENFFLSDDSRTEINRQIAYLVMYPLLMACSYNRAFNGGSFNIEYIIPNLFLQWISKEKSTVSGISYFSTKTLQLRHSKIGVNFVFPPDSNSSKLSGFCEKLEQDFYLSKPISWQLLDTINDEFGLEKNKGLGYGNLEEYFVTNYKFTKFHKVENIMDSFLVDKVSSFS
ncbi:hypothetical protein JEP98_09460 [Providencia rettgeri]|uniref:hypothetical protein n=1 Tax=Providencia rettgeri TaxID=587 RepID=UPI0018E4450D|nr:hypothetical protein [Providencia rettgeri]MBI6189386.1 hypothetical protein [Providencia rettgeri]